jgi:hypothetical protein
MVEQISAIFGANLIENSIVPRVLLVSRRPRASIPTSFERQIKRAPFPGTKIQIGAPEEKVHRSATGDCLFGAA